MMRDEIMKRDNAKSKRCGWVEGEPRESPWNAEGSKQEGERRE